MAINPYDPPSSRTANPLVKSRVGVALVCLHISAVLYLLLGLSLPLLLTLDDGGNLDASAATGVSVFIFIFCALIAAGVEVVAYGIHKRKFWGWVAGLIVFGIYAPSLFLPLGAFGLWGLLAAGSRAEFGVGGSGGQPTTHGGNVPSP